MLLFVFLVEVAGLELAASSTRNWRATNCATPRKITFKICAEWTTGLRNRAPRRAEQRRRIVVVRRSIHSLLQLVALGFRF